MFSHEGPARTPRNNSILAGYLAFVAGFVNAVGLLLLGAFTSHVTGNVGHFSVGLAGGESTSAAGAGLLVLLFFCGAVLASLLVETNAFGRTSTAYGVALLVQGLLLSTFVVAGAGGILSFCMGMQNSLVTRLSGSVVRTTHLTGVVTDLGIEVARWLRWGWSRGRGGSTAGRNPAARPSPTRSALFATIVVTFAGGGVCGALAAPAWGARAIAFPAAALLLAALYAFVAEAPRKTS
ncbi:MAG TPA: YoaK family protein [Polyangia bacterium]|nr:YoaK family protein [Polyangia bacterium]